MQNEEYTRIIFLNAKGLNHRITSNYRRLPQVSEKLCEPQQCTVTRKERSLHAEKNNYLFLCKETFSIYEEENEK